MKALIYGGPGKITCEAVDDPILPDSKGAIVRVSACSICGSDLHPYHVDMGRSGYCIGHEAVGEVVELGRDAAGFSVGDRVLIPGSLSCGACRPCKAGKVALCEKAFMARVYGQGIAGIGGCQAEAVAVPNASENLWRLPDALSDEIGLLLTDNLATAWYGARRARVGPGDVVAVIGLGSVGLQSVMSAFAMGAARVFAIDLVADRRAEAARLGAEPIEEKDVVAAVQELTGGAGVHCALDANGGAVTTEIAINLAGKGGRVSTVGVSEQAAIPFPMLTALRKGLEFHTGICSIQEELPTLLTMLEQGRLDAAALSRIFTHRMGLSEGAAAYELFNARRDGVKKIVLDPAA
ncbi:MAG: alcohol dehydrogenase catalytic domain-containing protein [Hyphomonadaceae bacterium]